MRTNRILIALIVLVVVAAAILAAFKTRSHESSVSEVTPVSGRLSLLVIGVSGLEESLFDRLSAEGRLPNLTALAEGGAVGRYSTLPRGTDSRIVWTSLVTGMEPENQGLGGKTLSPRGDMVDAALVPASRTVDTIWTILSADDSSCGVIGWPGTWPAEQLDGVVVVPHSTYVLELIHGEPADKLIYPLSEFASVDPLIIRPGDVTRRDLSRFVNLDSTLGLEALIGQNYKALADAYAADESMTNVAELVTADPGVENVFVCLAGTDNVSQRFWHYMDGKTIEGLDVDEEEMILLRKQVEALGGTIERYYEFMDELVGELVALADNDATIAVVSDHGYAGVSLDARGMPKVGVAMHSERGMWILRGPDVKPGVTLDKGSILEVAPTIMAAASIAAPPNLDGRVASAMLAQ